MHYPDITRDLRNAMDVPSSEHKIRLQKEEYSLRQEEISFTERGILFHFVLSSYCAPAMSVERFHKNHDRYIRR